LKYFEKKNSKKVADGLELSPETSGKKKRKILKIKP
jgi:DNA-binding CsgD family transcriptional regulator